MTEDEIKKLISEGEKIDVEFKKSENELNKDVYETVCSFNNRNGGYIFLGIVDGTREIRGVNPEKVDSMMKNFTTTVNNPNRINPPISKVFREIGYADELGSGMRNTNKYTKLYSGGTPAFIEDNIFEIRIPIANVAGLQVGPEETESLEHSAVNIDIALDLYVKLKDYLREPRTRAELQEFCRISSRDYFRTNILKPLLDTDKIKLTIPDKPTSSKQKYIWNED